MSEAKLCCNCLHCARWKTKDGIETHCDLNDKYLGYIQVMEENTDCKHWEKETKWDLQKEHDKQIRADAIDAFVKFANTMPTVEAEDGEIRPMWLEEMAEQLKEQKLCSNGQPCTHPNCKKCGTTHFMSECDYGKK